MNPARLNLPVLRQVPEAQVRILSHAPYHRMAALSRGHARIIGVGSPPAPDRVTR